MPEIPRRGLPVLFFIPAAGFLAVIGVMAAAGHVDVRSMTQDVTSLGRIHPLSGLLSNLGILLWWSTASICLLSAAAVRGRDVPDLQSFLLWSGALSAYLALDDLFRIHETLAPRYAGIAERHVYAVLVVAVAAHLLVFWRVILGTEYRLLLLALLLLSSSVAMDTVIERWMRQLGQWEFFLEDGAKWLGIVSWCAYYSTACLQAVGAAAPEMTRHRAPMRQWTPGDLERRGAAARGRVPG